VLFAAFTGKAASVLRAKGCHGATTIHSLIYRLVEEKEGKPVFRLDADSPVRAAPLLIVDECSMVDNEIGADLLSFNKCKPMALHRHHKSRTHHHNHPLIARAAKICRSPHFHPLFDRGGRWFIAVDAGRLGFRIAEWAKHVIISNVLAANFFLCCRHFLDGSRRR
jgi:hypothetical protein